MMLKLCLRLSAVVSIYLLTFSPLSANENLSIEDAWVKEAPPGVQVQAGYLKLENKSKSDLVLDKVESPDYEIVELHQTVFENDIARMQQQETITIEAKGNVELQPGGLHLMLIKSKERKKQGDEVSLNFHFTDGSVVNINAPVKKSTGAATDHSHHHHHH